MRSRADDVQDLFKAVDAEVGDEFFTYRVLNLCQDVQLLAMSNGHIIGSTSGKEIFYLTLDIGDS